MMYDILIHGGTQKEHDERLRAVLERLQKAGITLNHKKCLFLVSQLTFLGQVVDSSGIRPDPEKVSAILSIPAPTDVSGVRRFLGVVNQMSKFIPNVAERTHPLRELLVQKNQWVWGEPQEKAFQNIKESLVRSPVLALFNPNYETIVSEDASSYGLSAVLLQRQPSAEFKPVAFVSRSMTNAEVRYAQIEEALAFNWSCVGFQTTWSD